MGDEAHCPSPSSDVYEQAASYTVGHRYCTRWKARSLS